MKLVAVCISVEVGDPAQLPATVISDVAKNHGYGTSLFERLMQAGYPVKMLKTQYRMHPELFRDTLTWILSGFYCYFVWAKCY
ncbi:probable helicase MAGATAMA 3 isoform X2 [Arachis ipaensis]|uniref:probable helicase MAGATAMA 3 isoform X2 n=1 Tax=Arachis ipaensis TaxID=130454 RepID=UPI0007AEF1C1|nr:probable helicase MAGATAMA 3 isoform X2 [Arachis ipaensis]